MSKATPTSPAAMQLEACEYRVTYAGAYQGVYIRLAPGLDNDYWYIKREPNHDYWNPVDGWGDSPKYFSTAEEAFEAFKEIL
jgi:hypothetical protein